ncbi:AvrD family protein [Actinocrispum wychmicini]|uniref:Avirulence D protein (AvrD) n=1 Tax=Actinocrispum wychmicini TaxID=1213861 RepID=A0A4R2JRW0_9PSEU|nr:AvrD family protein [Actinocrispum wychmicini]TCO62294.1 avirulence D protein (AvrD) [Actinocrispum wychmicini]
MSTETMLDSIDDYLGAAETRFFGHGYQRVRYDVDDVAVTVEYGGQRTIQATAAIRYPEGWSTKSGGELRPHLSTIDGVLLGARLGEFFLAAGLGLDAGQRADAWLRRVVLRAGSQPQEDLSDLALRATWRAASTEPVLPGATVSIVDARVGAMKVRCEIEHRSASPLPGETRFDLSEELLGSDERRCYGTAFIARGQGMREIVVSKKDMRASAKVDQSGPGVAMTGMEAAYQPSLSMIDCFVSSLQLAQVLLYETDGLSRGESDTLWMRQTSIVASDPRRPWPGDVDTRLTDPGLVEMGDSVWRTARILGACAGMSLDCDVAHRLP